MSVAREKPKPLVLVTLFGGGWHREAALLLQELPAGEFDFAYAYGHCSGVHGAARLPMPHPGPCHPIHYLGPTRKRVLGFVPDGLRLLLSVWEACRLMRRLQPNVILAVGTATAIPLFIAGRLFGAACVFVESLTRVRQMSLTGRILHRLRLADRLYVQWSDLQRQFEGTVYAGSVI